MNQLRNENGKISLLIGEIEKEIIDLSNDALNNSQVQTGILYLNYAQTLNKFQTIYKYTFGETTLLDIIYITSLIYKKLMAENLKDVRALEVGSWFGCSSYFIVASLKAFSEQNYLYCMDTWEGNKNTPPHNIAKSLDVFEHFKSVMKYANVYDHIIPVICDSNIGMRALKQDYFDIIFIDANHTYQFVYNDILNSIEIIKPGGLLIGHDCKCLLHQVPSYILENESPETDGKGCYYLGVIRAVNDIFGMDIAHPDDTLLWYKIITSEDKKRLLKV